MRLHKYPAVFGRCETVTYLLSLSTSVCWEREGGEIRVQNKREKIKNKRKERKKEGSVREITHCIGGEREREMEEKRRWWGVRLLISLTLVVIKCINGDDPYRFFTWNVTFGDIYPLGVKQQVLTVIYSLFSSSSSPFVILFLHL